MAIFPHVIYISSIRLVRLCSVLYDLDKCALAPRLTKKEKQKPIYSDRDKRQIHSIDITYILVQDVNIFHAVADTGGGGGKPGLCPPN